MKENKKFINAIKKITKEICSCPKKARTFLIKSGVCDKNGNIIKKKELNDKKVDNFNV